jgi:TatD DNase family protein
MRTVIKPGDEITATLPVEAADPLAEAMGSPIEVPPDLPLELIDSHAHLDVAEFDADRDEMLMRAQVAGVRVILAIGGGIADADDPRQPAEHDRLASAIPFAEQYDWIYAAAGVHPHEAALATASHYEKLSRLAEHPRFLAWGEIGLDYHYDHSPREVQQRVFIEQLELASIAKCPVILHCRDAWVDCLRILEKHWQPTGLGGVFHCFTGTHADALIGIEMGFMISFAGNVTFPKAQNLREIARVLPLKSMLIETDSPFLAPPPYRGRRNEPAYVAEVARTLGPVRNLAASELASATADNFRRFFKISDSGDPSSVILE